MAEEKNNQLVVSRLGPGAYAGVALVSAIYFVDIFIKARQKCYWFDELFTVYLCRLPSMNSTWNATLHGADFNPPLFYWLVRLSHRLFGDGLIATRLPATLGVWVFGLCLFLFVARRAGVLCGFIAGAFPFFTLVQYYAYEARAHGIVLGWCGLALLCWQRNAEGRARYLWLAGFAFSLVGALLTHLYAVYLFVPFALTEFYSLLLKKRLNGGVILVMLIAFIPVVVLVYLPLVRAYRATTPPGFFVPPHAMLQSFLVGALGPAISILLLSIVLFGFAARRRSEPALTVEIPQREMVLAVGFVLIPLLGFLGSRISHGPFIDRYFLSSIAGFSMFLGFAHSGRRSGRWGAPILTACMATLMVLDLAGTIYLAREHRISLIEPSSRLVLSTTPSEPMAMYRTVALDRGSLDVLVLPRLAYFYFYEYAPRSVVPRLYFAADADDPCLGLYQKLQKWAFIDFNITTFASFLARHDRFLVYANGNGSDLEALQAIAGGGYRLQGVEQDVSGTMYEFAR